MAGPEGWGDWSVSCINGHVIEGERPDTLPEERRPCPECGTTGRAIAISVNDRLSIGVEEGSSPHTIEPESIQSEERVYPPVVELVERVAVLLPVTYRVEWIEPTGPEGSYTLSVYGPEDELLDMAESRDPEDAILAVAERLDPRNRR
jgi:hypothetical protein